MPVTVVPAPEAEPNDDASSANPLSASGSGTGTTSAGDLDVWTFEAVADTVVQLELHATRLDQARWNESVRFEVVDPAGDVLVRNYGFGTVSGSAADYDIWGLTIEQTGTHHIRVSTVNPTPAAYAVTVRDLDLPELQHEEVDSTPEAPLSIAAGVMSGALGPADLVDAYAFAIDQPTIVAFEAQFLRLGMRDGGTTLEPGTFALVDPAGVVLAEHGFGIDAEAALRYLLDQPGTYTIRFFTATGVAVATPYFLIFEETAAGTTSELDVAALGYGATVHGDNHGPTEVLSFEGTAGDLVRIYTYDHGTHQRAQSASTGLLYELFEVEAGGTLAPVSFSSPFEAPVVRRAWLPRDAVYEIHISGGDAIGTPYAVELERFSGSRVASGSGLQPFDAAGFASATTIETATHALTAEAGELVTLIAHAAGVTALDGWGSSVQPVIEVTRADLTPVASVTAGGPILPRDLIHITSTAQLGFIADTAATYLVHVTGSSTGPASHYALQRVLPRPPRIALPPRSRTPSYPPNDPVHLDACPTGHAIVGFHGHLHDPTTLAHGSAAALCAPLRISTSPASGPVELGELRALVERGSGDPALDWTSQCPADQVVVGFSGRAFQGLHELRLRCAPLIASRIAGTWTFTPGEPAEIDAIGGSGGFPFDAADCAPGEIATVARTSDAGVQLASFGLGCARPHIRVVSDTNEP